MSVTMSDSESIFWQQFGKYHGYDVCYSLYFYRAQSLGSRVHYKRSQMTILGLAGV